MEQNVAISGQLGLASRQQGKEPTAHGGVPAAMDTLRQKAKLCEIFLAKCANIPDFRQPGKVEYPIIEILFALLVGTLCTANTAYHAILFAEQKLDFLREHLPYINGIASHDTACRVLRYLNCTSFSKFFMTGV
jgi:hypothetical protein